QHRRHQRASARAGEPHEQPDDRAAQNYEWIDMQRSQCVEAAGRGSVSAELVPRSRSSTGGSPYSSQPSLEGRTSPRRARSDTALVTVGLRAATSSARTAWVSRSGTTVPSL